MSPKGWDVSSLTTATQNPTAFKLLLSLGELPSYPIQTYRSKTLFRCVLLGEKQRPVWECHGTQLDYSGRKCWTVEPYQDVSEKLGTDMWSPRTRNYLVVYTAGLHLILHQYQCGGVIIMLYLWGIFRNTGSKPACRKMLIIHNSRHKHRCSRGSTALSYTIVREIYHGEEVKFWPCRQKFSGSFLFMSVYETALVWLYHRTFTLQPNAYQSARITPLIHDPSAQSEVKLKATSHTESKTYYVAIFSQLKCKGRGRWTGAGGQREYWRR